jgi:NAD(P)-dependent dehydrogenase (short-subunit alcohol dehydrogenase family)
MPDARDGTSLTARSEDSDVRHLARRHAERFGSLDLLVLCAGFGASGPIAGYPMRRFDRQVEVNLRAQFQVVHVVRSRRPTGGPGWGVSPARHQSRGTYIV